MSQWLKQSTVVTIQLGPFLDEDDGKAAEVGLAIAQADVRLSKNGGAFAQKNDVNAAAHDEVGWYRCQINATDTNTLGRLIVAVHESGALPVWREFMVVPANEYDSLIAGSDVLEVDATLIEGGDATDAINAACDASIETYKLDHLVAVIDGDDPVDNSIIAKMAASDGDWSGFTVATDSLEAIRDKETDIETDTNELQTDWTNAGRLDALLDGVKAVTDLLPDAGALDDLALILADTNELQTDWTNAGRLDVLLDAIKAVTDVLPDAGALDDLALILADTNELQTDDIPAAIAALPTAIENADAVLSRGVVNVEDAADTTSLAALVLARFESAVAGAVWTVRKTTGAAFVVKTVTLDAAADPIVGVT